MKRKTCEECGGNIVKKAVDYVYLGQNLGKFPAEVCTQCGEEVFEEDVTKKVAAIAKQKGIWGISDRGRINKIGSSLGVIINKKIAQFLELKKGEEIIMYPENKKRLVIQLP
jgi:YgiT-type zinc finger domain-containing protein